MMKTIMNAFNLSDATKSVTSVFYEKYASIIDIMKKHSIKKDTLHLPRILIIGNEKTGKSSLIENILKARIFPKDTKICTKAPIHIMLVPNDGKELLFKVKLPKANYVSTNNELEVKNIIQNYFNELGKNFSDDEVLVEVYGEFPEALEFYDMPGLISEPKEQSEYISNIYKKYMSNKNDIIVLVADATNASLRTLKPVSIILEEQMQDNTIICLTKIDNIPPEYEDELLFTRLVGDSEEMKDLQIKRCVAVQNLKFGKKEQTFEKLKKESEERISNLIKLSEESDLELTDKQKNMIKNSLGIDILLPEINKFYDSYMKKHWKPKLLEQIKQQLFVQEKLLNDLGVFPISQKDRKYMSDCLNVYINDIIADQTYEDILISTMNLSERKLLEIYNLLTGKTVVYAIDLLVLKNEIKKNSKPLEEYILTKFNEVITNLLLDIKEHDDSYDNDYIKFYRFDRFIKYYTEQYNLSIQKHIPIVLEELPNVITLHDGSFEFEDDRIFNFLYKFLFGYIIEASVNMPEEDCYFQENNDIAQLRIAYTEKIDSIKKDIAEINKILSEGQSYSEEYI